LIFDLDRKISGGVGRCADMLPIYTAQLVYNLLLLL